jgi:hypothetical protein
MVTWDSVGLSGTLATVTVLLLQFLKPFVELIPGITLAVHRDVHDNLLRALQFLINLGLLLAAQAFIPGAYVGVTLLGMVLTVLGQFGFSELTYQQASKGGSATLPNPPFQFSATYNNPVPAASLPAVAVPVPPVPVPTGTSLVDGVPVVPKE